MKRLRIAIVGLHFGGYIIDELLHGPASRHFEVAAVCDLDRAKARTLGRRLKCRAHTDLDALLAEGDIPAVGLFTGPHGRAAFDVLREARRRGRVIHINLPSPFLSADLALHAVLLT